MTTERDPLIQRLFEAARRDTAGEDVVNAVISRIQTSRRRAIVIWSCVGLVFAGIAWVFTPAVVETVGILSRVLPQSLIEVTDPDAFIARLLAPLNSVAVPVAILLLCIRKIYKMLF